MGIYSHQSIEQLTVLRDKLQASLTDRLTKPTSAGSGDRNARFDQQVGEIRKELKAVCDEISLRSGTPAHRPIYLV